ncbi:MAG: lipoyl synthase [Candidatus Woesearchaeota archaeon]
MADTLSIPPIKGGWNTGVIKNHLMKDMIFMPSRYSRMVLDIPDWIKTNSYDREKFLKTYELVKRNRINTVCVHANCPNRYECFSNRTATFMILGDKCSRDCRYCNVKHGIPASVADEPEQISRFVEILGLKYVVITSVTRDDLEDGGASVFVECVNQIKEKNNDIRIELLIPDLKGNWDALAKIVETDVDVLNHNIEIVERLFSGLRPDADYKRSLELLKKVKEINPLMKTKSGLMIGFGETKDDIVKTLKDLRGNGVEFLSIGQYLSPSANHAKVEKYYSEQEFDDLKQIALYLGFVHVESGPLVRSSYHAHLYEEVNTNLNLNIIENKK